MGMDSVADKQLHLDVHDQVNVTWGLVVVVHVELVLWITDTDTVCRINQSDNIISSHSFIHIDKC